LCEHPEDPTSFVLDQGTNCLDILFEDPFFYHNIGARRVGHQVSSVVTYHRQGNRVINSTPIFFKKKLIWLVRAKKGANLKRQLDPPMAFATYKSAKEPLNNG
jgi:hypothetical protein